jgi:hypothetical protein
MNTEISQFEAKAYKRLYELQKSTLLNIINWARNAVDYKSENQKEMNDMMRNIADEHKWDTCGIESKTNSIIIDELEKCLSK